MIGKLLFNVIVYCLVFQAMIQAGFAQQDYEPAVYHHKIELQHDNDFFTFTDRYYSSGLFLGYSKLISKGRFAYKAQLDFRFVQEIYTPSQTNSEDSSIFDRPYAGFVGLQTTWNNFSNSKQLWIFSALLGIAGNNSGAGGFQRWYHKVIAIVDAPQWRDEIANSFHTNFYGQWVKEWSLRPNPFSIHIALMPKIALGTRDIFVAPQTAIYFGRRDSLSKSSAYNRLGSNAKETYFAIKMGYRRVFYDGLLEGNLFGDSSPVRRAPNKNLFLLGLDLKHRFKASTYTIGVYRNSRETALAQRHHYVQLAYSYSF